MTLDEINKKLAELYGNVNGHPNFRVASTLTQTEKRFGEYVDYGPNNIYLRTVREVREVKKYPAFQNKEYWVLEKYFPNTVPEIVKDTTFLYEPLMVFYNPETREPLPLNWEAVNAVVHIYLFSEKQVKSPKDIAREEEEHFERESQKLLEILQDDVPLVATQLHVGEGIVVPRNYNAVNRNDN